VHTLEATPEQAEVLGIAAGPLNAKLLEQVLQGKDGVLQHLSNPDTSKQAEGRLAALWEVLIPPAIRATLQKDEYKGLVVVPDGSLGVLPFETLIVEAGEAPKYLLDVAPPIVYAPSLTLLLTLVGREALEPKAKAEQPVLTLGDPVYGGSPNAPAQARSGDLRTRYGTLGGKLLRLPYTATESHWVKQALEPVSLRSVQLLESQATEAAVRSKIQGRRIVHLACHGLADQAYGNFFGALALTPGPQNSGSTNDGFLTLAEVCELDLRGNELTLLSACQTNFGPQQQGEGVWALTRGFLVAGSRRVMASNWVVDDKAAATLVYHFAANIAAGEKTGELDYAAALCRAKQTVRKQEKWQSPYYWGTFVLVGPN
jgi:CHAT domain-containing protein